jgi:hypothetical protein
VHSGSTAIERPFAQSLGGAAPAAGTPRASGSRRLARGLAAQRGPFRARALARRGAAGRCRTPLRGARRLTRKRLFPHGATAFLFQRAAGGARPPRCGSPATACGAGRRLGAVSGFVRGRRAWRRQLHARAPRLGQPDGNGLLRRPCTVLSLTHVMNLFAYEWTGLRRWRPAGTLGGARTLQRFSFRHYDLPRGTGATPVPTIGGCRRTERVADSASSASAVAPCRGFDDPAADARRSTS